MPDATPALPGFAPIAGDADTRALQICSVHPSPLNPRKHFDQGRLDELEDSIVQLGVLEALLVRPITVERARQIATPDRVIESEAQHYEIIAGERRWRAAKAAADRARLADSFRLPARLIPASDEDLVMIAATENLQREDMPPLDEAMLFDAMRQVLKKTVQGRPEAEIARRLKISERTIFNRLKLLRCAPEIQAALSEGKIKLQQAEAFALGEPKEQKRIFSQMARQGVRFDLDEIKDELTRGKLTAAQAQFDLATYDGEIIEDDEGQRFFADEKAAQALQNKAIAAKLAALKEKWPWAKRIERNDAYGYRELGKAAKGDDAAGAILYVDWNGDVVVKEGVLTPEQAAKREQARRKSDTANATANKSGKEKVPARLYTNAQLVAIKRAKTMALRSALLDQPRVALALAIMGLMKADMVQLRPQPSYKPEADGSYTITAAAKRLPALKHIAALTGAALKDLEARSDEANDPFPWDNEDTVEAKAFRAVLELPDEAQWQMLTVLMTRLIGADLAFDGSFHDSAAEIALAQALRAEKHLDAYWQPDADYFKAMRRDQRIALAQAVGLCDAALPAANSQFQSMKSDEQVAALVKLGEDKPGIFKPELFPALRFADEKEMKKLHAPSKADGAKPAAKAKAAAKPKPKAAARKKTKAKK